MKDKLRFLIASLDFHIGRGIEPADAWAEAVRDYAYVYHSTDSRTTLSLAAERALQHTKADEELALAAELELA